MNDKKFNKWFSSILMGLMVVAIAITTVFKLGEPDARVALILIAAAGSVAVGGDKLGLSRVAAVGAFVLAAAFIWVAIVVLIRFFTARAVFYGALQPVAADAGERRDGVDGCVGI